MHSAAEQSSKLSLQCLLKPWSIHTKVAIHTQANFATFVKVRQDYQMHWAAEQRSKLYLWWLPGSLGLHTKMALAPQPAWPHSERFSKFNRCARLLCEEEDCILWEEDDCTFDACQTHEIFIPRLPFAPQPAWYQVAHVILGPQKLHEQKSPLSNEYERSQDGAKQAGQNFHMSQQTWQIQDCLCSLNLERWTQPHLTACVVCLMVAPEV